MLHYPKIGGLLEVGRKMVKNSDHMEGSLEGNEINEPHQAERQGQAAG
jgi:hypothetical protein